MATEEMAEIERELETLAGCTVSLWSYVVTHRQMIFRVERPREVGNVHVVCTDSTHFEGDVWWRDAKLMVEDRGKGQAARFLLTDRAAAFKLECGWVRFEKNVPPVR